MPVLAESAKLARAAVEYSLAPFALHVLLRHLIGQRVLPHPDVDDAALDQLLIQVVRTERLFLVQLALWTD